MPLLTPALGGTFASAARFTAHNNVPISLTAQMAQSVAGALMDARVLLVIDRDDDGIPVKCGGIGRVKGAGVAEETVLVKARVVLSCWVWR